MAWCRANPEAGPTFLARVLPTLKKTADGTSSWHPVVRGLIDNFGKAAKFREALRAAMHTFGWSGSLTTYFSLYLRPLKELVEHPVDEVRLWATTELARLRRTIDREHNRDAEQEGYFDA